jgi:hypothetical protein
MVLAVPGREASERNEHNMSELAGLLIGFILTLLIYSYLLGDNPLYRLAVHVLVGVSAAYAAVVVVQQVILPVYAQIRQDPTSPSNVLWLIPTLFALLLLLKRLPTAPWFGNSTMALLVGVGAAVALTGSVMGTLWPQVTAVPGEAATDRDLIQGLIVALLTACTLLTFHFTSRVNDAGQWRRPFWQRGFVHIGRAVLMVTFGALFAGVFNTSLILLTERANYFLNEFLRLLS